MPNYQPFKTGHGHVWARTDSVRAHCGGPRTCPTCTTDFADAVREFAAGRAEQLEDGTYRRLPAHPAPLNGSSGRWVRRQANEHHCNTHRVDLDGATAGDLWECSCGKTYRVGESQLDGVYLSSTPVDDERLTGPHTRGCPTQPHDHGPGCHRQCPTCGDGVRP